MPKTSALEASLRELSEDVSCGLGTGTLLLSSNPAWETAPGSVMHTIVYGKNRL